MLKVIKKKVCSEKIIVIACLLFFIVQIIPILYLGQFNHPTSDDFQYGTMSHETWQETQSILAVVATAVKGVAGDYQRWQGSYSALFLMRLEPTVFAEWCYGLVPFIMIGLLTISTLYMMHAIFKYLMKSRSWHFVTVALLVTMLSIQFSLVAAEQFFWYNSSVYYNAYHAFMLFYLAWAIKYIVTNHNRYLVYMAIFGIVIGGGNYVTALTTILILMTAIVLMKYFQMLQRKQKQESCMKNGQIVFSIILWIELVVAFGISAMAPGNAARAQTTGGYGAISTIVHSILQGANYYLAWINPWWILVMLLCIPIFLKLIQNIKFSFPKPGIVLIYTYGLFCAMACPTFYALGSTGPGRVVNIIYDAFLWISGFQFFYLLGWSIKQLADLPANNKAKIKHLAGQIVGAAVMVLVVFLLFSRSFMETTTITALKVWVKGEGKQYDLEYKQRLAILEDDSISDVVFQPYTVEPDLVFIADGTDDPNFINNTEWADFYGKNSLIIQADSEETDAE